MRLTVLLLLLLFGGCLAHIKDDDSFSSGLSDFFKTVDKDNDGQIEVSEALQYIEQSFGPQDFPDQLKADAVENMKQNLDTNDIGATISKLEVEQHLRSLMQVSCLNCDSYTRSSQTFGNW